MTGQDTRLSWRPSALRHEIGVTSYFSLARGFLSGKYRSTEDFAKSAARGASMAGYLNARGRRILAALDAVASKRGPRPRRSPSPGS